MSDGVKHGQRARLVAVAPNTFAWIGSKGDSNAGALRTPDGVLIVDTQQHRGLARQLRQAVQSEVGQPVLAVINTHGHLDHISGNVEFPDAPVLAHENTLAWLDKELGPRSEPTWSITSPEMKLRMFFGDNVLDLVPADDPERPWFDRRFALPEYNVIVVKPPTVTFADRFAYHFPDERIELLHWGPAHTDGDLVVYLVGRKIAFLGDLVFLGRVPWLGDCDIDGWIETLGRILALDVDVVIPGHGPPATLHAVSQFRTLLMELRAGVDRAIRSGLSEEAAMREVVLDQYAHMPRYTEWMRFNVRAVYRSLHVHKLSKTNDA